MGKYLHKNKTKINIPVCLAAVLLCLTLFSTYLAGGLFARYVTSGQNGDNAGVAKFSIKGSGGLLEQTIEAELIPGGEKSVDLQIVNDSEVAVAYTVTVTNRTRNLPLGFRIEKSGTTAPVAANDEATFTEQRLPGSYTDNYTLYIEWEADKNDPAPMGMVDYITVTVTAVQTD